MKGILGKKLGMTQLFTPEGNVVPVTVIQAGPCVVLQKKDVDNDGYESIQIGFDDVKASRIIKPELGHAKKAGATPKRYVKEIRGIQLGDYEVGQELKADLFAEGEFVDVTGTSKGKGFKVTSKDITNPLGQWHTDHVITADQVRWVPFKQTAFLKVKNCQDIWVTKR